MMSNIGKWNWLGASVVALALAGCSTSEHLYVDGRCITCINNPLTGEAINHDPEVTGAGAGDVTDTGPQHTAVNNGVGEFQIESRVDVDTAYARIRSNFSFRSPDDFNDNYRSDKLAQMDAAWHHETTPGAFYKMSDYEDVVVGGSEHDIILKTRIERNGDGSRLAVKFFPLGPAHYDTDAVQAALQQRFETALR